jgi:O-antigen/teichoic acid export membrane protein
VADRLREAAVVTLLAAYAAEDNWHAKVRILRNTLRMILGAATVLALFFMVVGLVSKDMIGVCFEYHQIDSEPALQGICPSGLTTKIADNGATIVYASSRPYDILLIEIFGIVGAAITVISALPRMKSAKSAIYRLDRVALLIKLPTGALTALGGIMLIRGEFIPGLSMLDTGPQILAWSLVFGASQYLVTFYLDRRVDDTLEKEDAGRGGPVSPIP